MGGRVEGVHGDGDACTQTRERDEGVLPRQVGEITLLCLSLDAFGVGEDGAYVCGSHFIDICSFAIVAAYSSGRSVYFSGMFRLW